MGGKAGPGKFRHPFHQGRGLGFNLTGGTDKAGAWGSHRLFRDGSFRDSFRGKLRRGGFNRKFRRDGFNRRFRGGSFNGNGVHAPPERQIDRLPLGAG
jgi:hypothetical protein